MGRVISPLAQNLHAPHGVIHATHEMENRSYGGGIEPSCLISIRLSSGWACWRRPPS